MRHARNHRHFEGMNYAERLAYMATANRVTVGTITQVYDNDLRQSYVAKVRGFIVSSGETYKFDTVEEARKFGQAVLARWKQEHDLRNTPNQRAALDFFTEDTEPL